MSPPPDPSRDLLFGLLALQVGLIDQGQLVAALVDRRIATVPLKTYAMRLLGQRPRYQEGPPEGAIAVW